MYTGGNYASGGMFSPFDFLGNAGIGRSQMQMAAGRPQYNGPLSPTSTLSPSYGAPTMQLGSGGMDLGALSGLLGGLGGGSQQPQMIQENPNIPRGVSIQELIRMYRGG